MSKGHGAGISILGGSHRLEVLGLSSGPNTFTVNYAITPPLPDDVDPNSMTTSVFLRLEATDDLGNEYLDAGGARGLGPDGTRTMGSISASPAPPLEASTLTATLVVMREAKEAAYELVFPLRPER
ncbi:MAG: hypothetical protein JO362_15445 [Streptomycetaceae bacterium]|nr:hypothetical protein [Streptomycetaceae bacterium]